MALPYRGLAPSLLSLVCVREQGSGPSPLTTFRLFCFAFVLSFAGIMTNIAFVQSVYQILERRYELSEPTSSDEAEQLRFVSGPASPWGVLY